MKIKYQGKNVETQAATVTELLKEAGIGANAVIEHNGEIYSSSSEWNAPIHEGDEINAFQIVSGG